MSSVVITDCIRTPMGRSKGGVFRQVRADTLSAHLMRSLLVRAPQIVPEQIDDIYWGCVQQTLEQGFNIARNAALLAGLPHTVPATTINRLCGSSMQAIHDAARAIMLGDADICIVGGVEHMGHAPMAHGIDFNPLITRYAAHGAQMMGLTAELLGRMNNISRQQQDEFATRSQQRAFDATKNGRFAKEIVATEGHDQHGTLISVDYDEIVRADTTVAGLSQLLPAFDPIQGTITAGNSSAISDGAAALMLMSEEKAKQLNMTPRARVKAMAVAGCDPSIMGYGPIPATQKLLQRAQLSLDDIDLIELNEAFAAQSLSCVKKFGLINSWEQKVNINGGAIALGHPLGCSGARISTTLINNMEQQDVRWGLATLCIGLGQGIATLFERPASS